MRYRIVNFNLEKIRPRKEENRTLVLKIKPSSITEEEFFNLPVFNRSRGETQEVYYFKNGGEFLSMRLLESP